jgi:hypothetical protein
MNKKFGLLYIVFAVVGVLLVLTVMVSSCHTGNDPQGDGDGNEVTSVHTPAPLVG